MNGQEVREDIEEETDSFEPDLDDLYLTRPQDEQQQSKNRTTYISTSYNRTITKTVDRKSAKIVNRSSSSRGVRIQQPTSQAQRRESFLYRRDKSISPEISDIDDNDDLYLTPFAQILARLKDVRSSLGLMIAKGADKPQQSFLHNKKNNPKDDQFYESIVNGSETLDSLNWCLYQLEKIQTSSSVSDMAKNKFKMMLNHDLSVFSKSSKSGQTISKHITDTYYDNQYDHDISSEDEKDPDRHKRMTSSNNSKWILPGSPVSKKMSEITASAGNLFVTSGLGEDVIDRESSKLPNINKWGLDVFSASRAIQDSRVLTCTTYKIFQERNLCQTFKINPRTLLTFLMTIEDHYHKTIPYHNHLHAADVTQSTHMLLSSQALKECFTPLEIMAAILACAVHDVDHPGLTNGYLINTGSDLALMYNDNSVLENHHIAVAFKLLQNPACDIFSSLSSKQRTSVRKMMIDMVLATDMSKHMKLLADLKTMVETKKVAGSGVLLLDEYNDRIQVLQNMVHCSDLSNPTKPWGLYKEWVEKLMHEFWAQGDREKEEGLEVSAMCDRDTANIEKSQVGFISFIVQPLWETWAELVYPDINYILDILKTNKSNYEKLLKMTENQK